MSVRAPEPPLDVVAAILPSADGTIWLTRRRRDQHLAGLLEFPGGKRESQESVGDALRRELDEELGIKVQDWQVFTVVEHAYPERSVRLVFACIDHWDGEPQGREGQLVERRAVELLKVVDFPAANRMVVEALRRCAGRVDVIASDPEYRLREEYREPELRARDEGAIHRLTETAFRDQAHSEGNEAAIVNRLRNTNALSLSLVAEYRDSIIGHIAFSPLTSSNRTSDRPAVWIPGWYGLGPLSVARKWRRRGIASALVRQGLTHLMERGAIGCVLLGDPDFYSRFGFRPKPNLTPPDLPAEYFQAVCFAGRWPTTSAAFHPAFDS